MSSLAEIIDQAQFEIQVDEQGNGYASIRAVARLCQIDQSGLTKSLNTLKATEVEKFSKLAIFLYEQGFQPRSANNFKLKGIEASVVGLIVEFYAFEAVATS
jgi:hypothetical protein